MSRKVDVAEAEADLICPHCDKPIKKLLLIRRELEQRAMLGGPVYVQALACPACHRLVGFYQS